MSRPVVREIALHRLKADPRAAVAAHRSAAGHYTRHFTAKQIVNAGALGGAFVEARYHLVQAGEETQLQVIASRFGEHLRSLYSWVTRPAADPEERDEQIIVLSAFLQTEGPKGMEYYLARLLVARGRSGDRIRALEHVRRSTGRESPVAAWELRLRVEFEEEGPDSMLKAAKQGFRSVRADANLFALYQAAGELLARANRHEEAVALLREGIGKIPADKSLFALYQAISGVNIHRGDVRSAIVALRQGIGLIPVHRAERGRLISAALYAAASIADADLLLSILADCGATSARHHRSILAIATEWESRHGGLSTFNRDLCRALARAGHRVVCVVPEAAEQERHNAERDGVQLVVPEAPPGLGGTEKLLADVPLPDGFRPDLIIGHDRKTGPHAAALVRRLSGARRVHFVHTRPEDIEWHKDRLGEDDAAFKGEERRMLQEELAAGASLVAGVGPALFQAASSLLYLASPRPLLHRLDPGIQLIERPPDLPPEVHCLVLGRAEDRTLKGLDSAARSLAAVARRAKVPVRPRLIVRGAPKGTGGDLRRILAEIAQDRLDIEVREYTADVETHETLEIAASEWERRIEAVLMDRRAAFASAVEVRQRLAEVLTWEDAVQGLEQAWDPLLAPAA